LARWERNKRRGMWHFVVFRGLLGFGLTMGIIGIIFEDLSRRAEAFPWYFMLGLGLASGSVWGLGTWFVCMRLYSKAPKTG